MASRVSMAHILRPLGSADSATMRSQIYHFSTTCAPRAAALRTTSNQDPNLSASRTASSTYPPPSMVSLPRPKVSRASRRTAHPPKKRIYPTRQPTHTQPVNPKLIPEPVEPLAADQCAPNLPYFVTRTPNQELPVYNLRKRGGSLKLTRIKKVDGDIPTLRDELKSLLGLERKDCTINPVTRHIILKGHYKPQVDHYLRQRLF